MVDSTGLSATNRGSYIEEMWRKEKRKFVKLHIVADRRTGNTLSPFSAFWLYTIPISEGCGT